MGKYYRRFKQNTWNGHIDIFVEMWDVGSMDVLFQADYVLWGNYHILEFSEARNVCVCDFLWDLFIFMFVTDLWRYLGF